MVLVEKSPAKGQSHYNHDDFVLDDVTITCTTSTSSYCNEVKL
jgi:hypothetical protein